SSVESSRRPTALVTSQTKRNITTARMTMSISAPPRDVAVPLAREKQARMRTRDASISVRYGRGPRLQTGAALQPPEVRMTLPGGALSRKDRHGSLDCGQKLVAVEELNVLRTV